MKRVFLTIFCAIFALGLFAQKVMIIHKADGTKLELPIEAIAGFDFQGKAQVNDDDYTQLTNLKLYSGVNLDIVFDVVFHTDDPYIQGSSYGTDWGILYSTSPDVAIENGTLVPLSDKHLQERFVGDLADGTLHDVLLGESKKLNDITNPSPVDLEFETTYYFRSYVYSSGSNEYFYSKVQSVYTDNPAMAYYGVEVDPALYPSGYVLPTDEAWESLVERFPQFKVSNGLYKPALTACWNEYLTTERVATIKAQCTTVYECCDGMLYVLDAIDDDFGHYALNYYLEPQVMTGYAAEEDCKRAIIQYVECDESWGIPGNGYWKYSPITATGNPDVTIRFEKPLLANTAYDIEVTFAPDAEKLDTLPSKCDMKLSYTGPTGNAKATTLVKGLVTNKASEATVVSFVIPSIEGFGEAYLELSGKVKSKEKDYSRILRIAQVKVTYLPVEEED